MLKDFAWSYFERTGSIEAYLTYRYLSEAVIEENEHKPSGEEADKPEDKPTGTDN